jgi:type IV fimbrial biogenesis protein FimT
MTRNLRFASRGFTLIELVTVVALVGILMTLAVPAFQTWIANSAIRSTADALQNGLRTASAEAVRRSQQVTFVLSASAGTFNGAATTTGSGNYWYSQAVPTQTTVTADSTYLVQTSPQSFANNGVSITQSNAAGTAGAFAVCFNSLGRLVTNSGTGSTWPNLPAACVASDTTYLVQGPAKTRPLKVVVSLGGKVRMCDPSKTFSTSTPDGC